MIIRSRSEAIDMNMRMASTSLRGAGHDLAGLHLVVVGVAEPLDGVVDLVAEVVGDALAEALADEGLCERGDAARDRKAHHEGGRQDERAAVPR